MKKETRSLTPWILCMAAAVLLSVLLFTICGVPGSAAAPQCLI